MATTANVVNLDALIRRADLAAPGDGTEEFPALNIQGLESRGAFYPALRKPDFQRETAGWSPEQVADLIITFAKSDLIPTVILWRAGTDVFIIDGAHRLSALIAWVHDDYGDGSISRPFFHNYIPEAQITAAQRARTFVKDAVGSYQDHKMALEFPDNARADVASRALRLGWQEIQAQWIRGADHEKAEKAFFRINQGGTKIDETERRILEARRSATALSARAILRRGSGHDYWKSFGAEKREEIARLGKEIYDLLFVPPLELPVKTLDVPVAGSGYGPHVLPFLFDFLPISNSVNSSDSSKKPKQKRVKSTESTIIAMEDLDGSITIDHLKKVLNVTRRICSNHPSSLGLHPALYFYSRTGVFQVSAFLIFVTLIREWDTADYLSFCRDGVREKFESFMLEHRSINDAVRKLGSGSRSRPRVVALYKRLIEDFKSGKNPEEVFDNVSKESEYSFLSAVDDDETPMLEAAEGGARFSKTTKGATYIRNALPSAPRCPTCGGRMHKNGMQVGHIRPKRDGGDASLFNGQMQHPFCNSTVSN